MAMDKSNLPLRLQLQASQFARWGCRKPSVPFTRSDQHELFNSRQRARHETCSSMPQPSFYFCPGVRTPRRLMAFAYVEVTASNTRKTSTQIEGCTDARNRAEWIMSGQDLPNWQVSYQHSFHLGTSAPKLLCTFLLNCKNIGLFLWSQHQRRKRSLPLSGPIEPTG